MAYTTASYIQNEFKNLTFSATSVITEDTIDQFIEEADAYIDMRLAAMYTVPLTGTYALILMRQLSTMIVAARVRKILEVKGSESTIGDKNEKNQAEIMIQNILNQNIQLSDAERSTTAQSFVNYNYDNDVEPMFDVEEDQW